MLCETRRNICEYYSWVRVILIRAILSVLCEACWNVAKYYRLFRVWLVSLIWTILMCEIRGHGYEFKPSEQFQCVNMLCEPDEILMSIKAIHTYESVMWGLLRCLSSIPIRAVLACKYVLCSLSKSWKICLKILPITTILICEHVLWGSLKCFRSIPIVKRFWLVSILFEVCGNVWK